MSQVKLRGCDLSHWNGNVDFNKLKESCDFVILKAGGSDTTDFYYVDKKFEANYNAAKAAGLKVGCYFYAGQYSQGLENGKREARYFHNMIKGKSFEMPVYLDYEAMNSKNDRDDNTCYALAFGSLMEELGYFFGIYGADILTFKSLLDYEKVKRFSLWVARYGKKPQTKAYHMWQYSSSGTLPGVKGRVDLDYAYLDLAALIQKRHFNNCK